MKKYLYILSQRYSGSTLLSFLLSTHPEISTIGERRKFYNKVLYAEKFQHHKAKHCSCGELFINCPYLNDIKESLLSTIDHSALRTNATELKIYENKYLNRLAYEIYTFLKPKGITPFKSIILEHQSVNLALINAILAKDGTSTFLDSSKIINHALYLSQIDAFDFHVVWLIRDPRAQINSAMKYHHWPIEKATNMWLKEMKNNEYILNHFNIKHIKLKYSSLCSNPTEEIQRVLNFIDIDEKAFSLNFRDQEHHIMGNHMRLQKDQKIKERTEWKDRLTEKEIKYIESKTKAYENDY